MKIRIVKHTVANGQPVYQGDEVEVSEMDGRELIGLKKGVLVEAVSMDCSYLIETTMSKKPIRHRGVSRGKR